MRIAVIGSGYVGLVSGACFAKLGHDVVCIDSDAGKVAALQRGEIPIYEPGLEAIVAAGMAAGKLRFATDLAPAVRGADVVLIAVGTPSRADGGRADLGYVHAAARQVAAAVEGFTLLVTKSTVPVGTGDAVERIVRETNPRADVAVVSNPEFLREGAAVEDFLRPDRIVVGFDDERARAAMAELYSPLAPAPLLFTSRRTAELIKYAANAFLAMKVGFINEMADLCDAVGADVGELAEAIGHDRRIGGALLKPGPGFGGSCFPKDIEALNHTAADSGMALRLVEATITTNAEHRARMVDLVARAAGGSLADKSVAVLGLTFKAGTDDVRESPALALAARLAAAGAVVTGYDPRGMEAAAAAMPSLRLADTAEAAARGADVLVIATEWPEFAALDLRVLRTAMRTAAIADLRNVLDPAAVQAAGFRYVSLGRPGAGGL